jgi:hypothetical protein
MTRLRISLTLVFSFGLVATLLAEPPYRPEIPPDPEVEAEIAKLTAEIVKYTDADGDGQLSVDEAKQARAQVVEAMVDRLPSASYISGGETSIKSLRQQVSQLRMDYSGDRTVDSGELTKFVRTAMERSQRTVHLPWEVQYRIDSEKTAGQVMRYTWALERERRIRDNYYWKSMAIRQQGAVWFEVQGRKRLMRLQADREIAEARQKADRDGILRENSPGLIPDTGKPAPPAEAPKVKP